MDVIDRLNLAINGLEQLGVEIRFEDLQGTPGGLCTVNGEKKLLVEVSLTSAEQLQVFEETIAQLKPRVQSAA